MHILLIHATANVEMGPVAKEHERVRRHGFQERFTKCLASIKITFGELLHYCRFVWMKAKFFVKDSSHVRFEIPRAAACLRAERLGEDTNDCLSASMFSVVLMLFAGPLCFFPRYHDPKCVYQKNPQVTVPHPVHTIARIV